MHEKRPAPFTRANPLNAEVGRPAPACRGRDRKTPLGAPSIVYPGATCGSRRARAESSGHGSPSTRPRARQRAAAKKEGPQQELRALEEPGDNLLSRIRTIIGGNCLTTVFGMGTGMASCLWSPGFTVAPRGHGVLHDVREALKEGGSERGELFSNNSLSPT